MSVSSVVCAWGGEGKDDGKFEAITAVGVGQYGRVYVLGGKECGVQTFEADGRFVCKWGNGRMGNPRGLAMGVCEGLTSSLVTAMKGVPILNAFPPGLIPLCLWYLGDDCIYVTDDESHQVYAFRGDGVCICKWGGKGRESGKFNTPMGCTVGSDGLVYVADAGNRRIQVFDFSGLFLREHATIIGSCQFAPGGIAVDNQGTIYVCGWKYGILNQRTSIWYMPSGDPQRAFHAFTSSFLKDPSYLSVSCDGSILYIVEGDCIHMMDKNGTRIGRYLVDSEMWHESCSRTSMQFPTSPLLLRQRSCQPLLWGKGGNLLGIATSWASNSIGEVAYVTNRLTKQIIGVHVIPDPVAYISETATTSLGHTDSRTTKKRRVHFSL